MLESVPFIDSASGGWQQINFATPVAISANTPYVASYLSFSGYIAYTKSGLASGVTNPPLTAQASSSTPSGNGVYLSGSSGAFPSNPSPVSGNYWVDVAFSPSASASSVIRANSGLSSRSAGSATTAGLKAQVAGVAVTTSGSAASNNSASAGVVAVDTALENWSAADSTHKRTARFRRRARKARREALNAVAIRRAKWVITSADDTKKRDRASIHSDLNKNKVSGTDSTRLGA